MKAIIIFVGFLVICACNYASADCDRLYATLGAGYKFDEQRYAKLNGVNYRYNEISPYSARLELGVQCNENLRFGVSHHSQWATGFPFNDIGEPYKTEIFIDYTFYWDI